MKRRGTMYLLIPVVAVMMTVAALFASAAKPADWDSDAARRKASYLYLQALDAFMADQFNLYGELLTKAYNLDPADPELRMRYGELQLVTAQNQQNVDDAFLMMMAAYDDKADDYFEGRRLMQLAQTLHRWDDNLRIAEMMRARFPQRNDVVLQLGRSYLTAAMLGDTTYINRALATFDSIESRIGKYTDLSRLKISALLLRQDTAAVVDELSALGNSSPGDPYTAINIGQIYNSISMSDSALVYLNRACKIDSTNGTAIMLRAQLYKDRGDSTIFESEALRAIKSPDLDLQDKIEFATSFVSLLYQDSTQYARIDSLFETLIDTNPGEVDVHRLYAEYLAETNQFARAADQMSYVVALDGSEKVNWLLLAQMLSNNKDYAEAARRLGEASHLFPNDVTIVRPQAALLMMADENEQALDAINALPDSVVEDVEVLSDIYSLRGDLNYKLGKRQEAYKQYEKSLKANPSNYMVMNNLAYFYAENDTLLDQAESYIVRALRYDGNNPTLLDTYAWVLYKKGDLDKAREYINRTLEAYDEGEGVSAEIYEHAGDISYRSGDIDQAVDYWKKALENEPEDHERIKTKIKLRKIPDNEP